ncbi:DUF58 domain-containing protein [Maribacter sp. 2307UL18-2]|uniref:DUF58 domain-containing protein n=1 Tax=Maribacter sp. 2307UL18-2 TaxID=3386274 RepID=UPI0039BC95BF
MKQDYRQLLEPKIINSISGLSLIARVIVDGYLSGLHQSRRVGVGLEFSQYRGYEPGDDMRLLDWKMLARSGRYYIKQSEIETHITVKFIVDASKSMVHTEKSLSKMDYVKVLTASLAHLAQSQGDAIGLYALNDTKIKTIRPTVQKQQYKRFLNELIQIEGHGQWPEKSDFLHQMPNSGHKELLFFITDMYESDGELTRMIQNLKTKRNELVVLHIMGEDELEFNYQGYVIFEDLETGAKVKVDTKKAKELYLRSLTKKMSAMNNGFLSQGIGYQLFRLNEPISEVLQLFLKRRKSLL